MAVPPSHTYVECTARLLNPPYAEITYVSTNGSVTRTSDGPESFPTAVGGTIAVTASYVGDLVIGLDVATRSQLVAMQVTCDKGGPRLSLFVRPGQRVVVPGLYVDTNCQVTYSAPDATVTYSDSSEPSDDGCVPIFQRPVSCPRPIAGDASTVATECAAWVAVTASGPAVNAPAATGLPPTDRAESPAAGPAPTAPRSSAPAA